MILTALALLIGSTVIGSVGTIALFEFFVRRQESRDRASGAGLPHSGANISVR